MSIGRCPRLSVGVLTVSDTCSKDVLLDQSGPVAESLLQEAGFDVPLKDCVPDNPHIIRCVIMKWVASRQVEAVLTLGGTGLSRRDVTSDIILELVSQNQRLPGIEHSLYSISLQNTPMGALSRFVAGVCNETLLITLPGSTRAVSQCIPVILRVMKHAIHQIKGWDHLVKLEHPIQYNLDKSILEREYPLIACTVVSRCRSSRYPMISVDEALEKIFAVCNFEMGIEAVFHKNALGRVLGRSLKSRQCIPPFDASIMDGYAVRFMDGANQLKVVGALYGGDHNCACKELVVTPGTCVRVSTGGPIPSGADCIVPVENTKLISKRKGGPKDLYLEEEDTIEVTTPPGSIGQFIRSAGVDLDKNFVFRRGLRLGPIPNAVLDRLLQGGYLPCLEQCRIGVLSTGNEVLDCVVSEAKPLVRDSNRPCLKKPTAQT
ncbi:molybdopterin biosynthesis protein, putative [Schistosoma mansoni]|uniref:molybdopterin biosynthesis protein, putative n=1 Tax=Schistosoma mansoni TaxID=6183 RepID=UPI00022C85E0|nr:molybdopterin biosynthesis protein, putative [Schistosoma mansoni]|eukprot:XP_018646559.1 molybdopterin biosynthesis protein, putative [Schistosoma mansoni]